MSVPDLAYVAVVTGDAARFASVFDQVLGLPAVAVATPADGDVPLIPVGRGAIVAFEPGSVFVGGAARTGLDHVAIAVADPAAHAACCGIARRDAAPGLAGTRQVALAPGTTCGIATRLCEPFASVRGTAPGTSAQVERIDHLGIASESNRDAIEVFCERLGCPVESSQTDFEINQPIESFTSDKYGVVYHSRAPKPVAGIRASFLTVGDCELELLQPFDPRGEGLPADGPGQDVPGNTRGDKGAMARYLERRGPGLHHLALKTPDIDATLGRLAGAGLRVIDRVGRPGGRRSRIGLVHPSALGGVLLHLVERHDI